MSILFVFSLYMFIWFELNAVAYFSLLCFVVRIGLLYIIAGLGGSLFSALFIKSNISVGASGALFGLLGSMLSELIINWTIYANKVFIEQLLITVLTCH